MKHAISILLLLLCSLAQELFVCTALADTPKGDVCSLPEDVAKKEYDIEMHTKFMRNLPPGFSMPNGVIAKFFINEVGTVSDVSVVKSSGSTAIDLTCVDAIYASSSLTLPDTRHSPQPPYPWVFLLPPEDYKQGFYEFEFPKTDLTATKSGKPDISDKTVFDFPLIPRELLHRMPGIFSAKELESSDNIVKLEADSNLLARLRIPWKPIYQYSSQLKKNELLIFSREIVKRYLVTDPAGFLKQGADTYKFSQPPWYLYKHNSDDLAILRGQLFGVLYPSASAKESVGFVTPTKNLTRVDVESLFGPGKTNPVDSNIQTYDVSGRWELDPKSREQFQIDMVFANEKLDSYRLHGGRIENSQWQKVSSQSE